MFNYTQIDTSQSLGSLINATNPSLAERPPGHDTWSGEGLIIFSWTAFAVSTLLLFARLYVNVRGLRQVAWYRDVLVVGAWLGFLGCVIVFSIDNDYDIFHYMPTLILKRPLYELIIVQKTIYAIDWLFLPSIYFIKADLLLLYHNLSPRAYNPKIFWLIIFGWLSTATGAILQICFFLFICPIKDQWAWPTNFACRPTLAMLASEWGMNIESDLVIYIIPLIIIYRMQKMTVWEKLSAAAVFFTGFLNIMGAVFCCLGLMVSNLFGPEFPGSWTWVGVGYYMTIAQCATALWIVCMPQLRSLYGLARGAKEKKDVAAFRDIEKNGVGRSDRMGQAAITVSTTEVRPSSDSFGSGPSHLSNPELEMMKEENKPFRPVRYSLDQRSPVDT